MMRLLVFCCALPLVAGCDSGSADPPPVPYTAVPRTPMPYTPVPGP
ncbi:hypothetical protein [Actinocorallia libanotica]